MEDKPLTLLSNGLRDLLVKISEKYKCGIATDLIEADAFIEVVRILSEGYSWWGLQNGQATINIRTLKSEIEKRINNEARMLSFRFNAFEISYLPKGKDPIYSDEGIWSRQNRQSAKPARIIQKLLVKKYSCKDYENFNNWLKAEMVNIGEFKIVEGSDISMYYLEYNYYKDAGTLGNSCMRYEECQKFFKVYEDNAKMLVLLKDNRILGRAILWEINGKTYMDRVYTCMDYLESSFVEYAESNNWIHRKDQKLLISGSEQLWLTPDDNYKEAICLNLSIRLNSEYKYMPYMDSFRYYNSKDNTLNTNPDNGNVFLHNSSGFYDVEYKAIHCNRCGKTEYVETDCDPDYLIYSEYEETFYCEDCCKYYNSLNDYFSIDIPSVSVCIDKETNLFTDYPQLYIDNYPETFENINNIWYFTAD